MDLTPVIATLSSIAAAWRRLRYGFPDVVPAARDTVIESMSDGLAALDARNRVVDLNPAAQRIIGQASLRVIGKPVAEVLNARPAMVEGNCREGGARGESVMGQGKGERCEDLQVSPVCDQQGRVAGRVIALPDTSEHSEAVFTHGICPDCMCKLYPEFVGPEQD